MQMQSVNPVSSCQSASKWLRWMFPSTVATPKSFAEGIVEGAAPAVHADLNFGRLQAGGESFGCELCAWVGVGELGSPLGQGLPLRIKTDVTVHCVGDLSGEEIAVVPANNCDLIDETTRKRKRGDVGAPLRCRFSADSDAA